MHIVKREDLEERAIDYEYRSCTTIAVGMLAVVGAASLANSLGLWPRWRS